jgi:hypothetical protein
MACPCMEYVAEPDEPDDAAVVEPPGGDVGGEA